MQKLPILEHETGICRIDTGLCRPGHTACYLLRQEDELAFIDTGTSNNLPYLLQLTRELGPGPEAVRYIMPTHVHLDHAGGAGALLQACPNATLVTHKKGVPHMLAPEKLQDGAIAVYGREAFLRDYGELVPAPAERVVAAAEDQVFELADRKIRFVETPGHANHHGCFFDELSQTIFTGDSFGLSYREFDSNNGPWVMATTTPVAFDPDAWLNSLDKIMAFKPAAACVTHFGRLENPVNLSGMLKSSIQAHVEIALEEENREEEGRLERLRQALEDNLLHTAQQHCPGLPASRIRELLAFDVNLNAQGLDIWLKRRARH